MRYLFEPGGADVLAELASLGHALLAFDYDGTLAPIAQGPTAAGMRRSTGALFRTVCGLYPTAVISGRGRADVAGRLLGATPKFVIGNHGLEPEGTPFEKHPQVDGARAVLSPLVPAFPGLELEDKRLSLSVHYRHAVPKAEAKAAVEAVLTSLGGAVRVMAGLDVFNVLPPEGPTKGEALLGLVTSEGAERALFAGDDTTDEDVFRLPPSSGLVTVRVGEAQDSAAGFFLRTQGEIDELLRRLIEGRQRSR